MGGHGPAEERAEGPGACAAPARAEKLLETLGVSENRTVVFREEGAAVQAGESIQDVPYTEFNALIETEDLYVLCFAQTGAFILRKRDMTEGEPAAFLSFLAERTGLTPAKRRYKATD